MVPKTLLDKIRHSDSVVDNPHYVSPDFTTHCLYKIIHTYTHLHIHTHTHITHIHINTHTHSRDAKFDEAESKF